MRSKQATAPLDHIFYALSDPTRRDILETLSKGEARVGELAEKSRLTLPAISKHLKVLEKGRLIERKADEGDGRVIRLSLKPQTMGTAVDWLEKHRRFWNDRLDELEKFMAENGDLHKEEGK
ncbi:MAG TPA: metalloregulator ArsR/SmtB family transcription factor [bacterium]|nr:metalloregulator ArsR/SmtB family transcription factor [bacterium]